MPANSERCGGSFQWGRLTSPWYIATDETEAELAANPELAVDPEPATNLEPECESRRLDSGYHQYVNAEYEASMFAPRADTADIAPRARARFRPVKKYRNAFTNKQVDQMAALIRNISPVSVDEDTHVFNANMNTLLNVIEVFINYLLDCQRAGFNPEEFRQKCGYRRLLKLQDRIYNGTPLDRHTPLP